MNNRYWRIPMQLKAFAKINWSLDILGRREDGYHLMDMVMQLIELHDDISLEPADALTLQVDGRVRVPNSDDNLVLRAAQALRAHAGIEKGASITLHKRIPVGAGLGGGSADAACVLHGLNKLWHLNYSLETLCEIGVKLGADIPFCLAGGLMRAEGIGEILTPLPCKRSFPLLVIQPCRGLSTREVFTDLHEMPENEWEHPDTESMIRALGEGNLRLLAASLGNTLQPVSEKKRPELRACIRALKEHGARAAKMTGSGSAVYGVFPTMAAARTAYESLRKKYRTCHLTYTMTECGYDL